MIHVFRLGPLEVGGREAYAYCGLDADRRLEGEGPRFWPAGDCPAPS